MNVFTIALAAGAVAVLMIVAPAHAATALSPQDSAFVTKLARGGAAEVADAKLALQTSRNQRIDAFANRMVTDHSKANAQLAAIMQSKGIPPPPGLGTENQTMYSRLEGLTGAAFNAAYLAGQKTAHQETIDLLVGETRAGKDAQLVAFAKQILPTVRSHMAMLTMGHM